ncbi:MAG: PIN domain-containing protein [Nanoarchaeota archaeon]
MIEEKVQESKFIDSSVWLSYLLEGKYAELIDKNESIIYTSPLIIFEVKLKLLQKNIPRDQVIEKIKFIKEKTVSIEINNKIADDACENSYKNKIPSIDSLIYASAISINSILITKDNDFRGLKNTQILK